MLDTKMRIGDRIPEITLKDANGIQVNLNELSGPLVVYFYPKDETSGCTVEACEFRDRYEEFHALEAHVIGISHDSVESHRRFADRHNLRFTLLSDENGIAKTAFDVKDSLFGLLKGRETFVFDNEMKLVYRFRSAIHFRQHISNALNALKQLKNDPS